jgi:nucleoside-diphosphate-sugar epimerase
MSYWVILGCGYIGTHLAKALLARGEGVLACARNKERLAELEAAGADTYQFEATRRHAFHYAMGNARTPIVIYCLPPYPNLPGGELVSRAAAESLIVGAQRFVYLSSTAVYGEGRDSDIVNEDTPVSMALDDPDARPFVSAEGAVEDARAKGLDALILRLSPVYGPGRGMRKRMLDGTYKLLDEGKHVYSRVHVDDVVDIIQAAVERAPINATYCVADDRPCPQREYAEWLSRHLGVRMPASVPSLAPGMPRRRVRNRGVSGAKLQKELDYTLRYPTYREGEIAIDHALGEERKDQGPPPLVIHRKDARDAIAKNTGLRRLSVRHETLEASKDARVVSQGETMVYVLSGAVNLDNGGDKLSLQAGDMVEVPAVGLPLKPAGDKPAELLIMNTRL